MAALDQLNGQLALSNAAVTQNENALAVHFHQHTVAGDAGGKFQIQHTDEAAHQCAGRLIGTQQRHTVFFCQFQHLGKRLQFFTAAHDNSRRLLPEQLIQTLPTLFLREARQEVHLRQAHDLQTQLIKIIIVTRQEQARTVDLCNFNTDVFQILRRVNHVHTDFLRQLFKRNGEVPHRFSSCRLFSSDAPVQNGGIAPHLVFQKQHWCIQKRNNPSVQ